MPREYPRRLRVAAELQRVLNELLTSEVKDPRLEGVTVSEVDVSGDLSVARVYFSTLDPNADSASAELGLRNASGFLRSRVGRVLRVRRTPELRFVHDEGPERGLKLTQLIDEVGDRGPSDDTSSGDGGATES